MRVRMRLYGDPDVKFGGSVVGGIKISHLSDIDKKLSIALTVTRGKRSPFTVEPLVESEPTAPSADDIAAMTDVNELRSWWQPSTPERRAQIEARVGELTGRGIE